ncbi:Phosphoglycerate dehydrogenase [Palleronia marisminoris]|uniref:Glycerate dehydrogenase n=1 Tax=Palleronia marisminoris TaxID=315423 RepID=A0A1Y5TQS0_9RHOB|nr:D-2-hydroxyacid dehydrogenase [Palleronia marisminoris]SFH49194.1 Phosphoglycerate dehydrogenase [Palleronia marisminoris]SLN69871.1 Glycerate dehydrogenase [Palleronia marisminoris]
MTNPITLASDDLPFDVDQWARLEAVLPGSLLRVDIADDAALAAALQNAEIAILKSDLDARILTGPKLKWVHCNHAGLTKSARPEVFQRGLIVTGSAGRSGPALAEHVMMFSLLLCSGYPAFFEAQKRHEWRREPEMENLHALSGRTMAIVGMGHTGKALALRAKAFDMTVLGYRRRDAPAPEGVDRMYSSDKGEGLDALLEQADILALVVNLSDATHHLIGAPELARMKRSSILVNLARGPVVDQDALLVALTEGRIAGAGLDVTTPEPLPPGHPLWDAPNTLITPHFTASLPDRSERSLGMILDNIRRYRAGEEMLNRISEEDLWSKG